MKTESIIIVTYNSAGVIEKCLEGLCSDLSDNQEIIVVDNKSTDNTATVIRNKFGQVNLIELNRNEGFAGAVLVGVAATKGRYLCLLNPDAYISASSLTKLRQRIEAYNLSIAAPLITHPGQTIRTISAGYLPTLWRMFTHYTGISRLAGDRRILRGHYLFAQQLRECEFVEWVTGACLMITRKAWENVGGLSRRWFMYAEDIDLCMRVHKRGGTIAVFPDLVASHGLGQSSSTPNPRLRSAWVLNLFDLYCRALSHSQIDRVCWRLVVGLGLMVRGFSYTVFGIVMGAPDQRIRGHQLTVNALDLLAGRPPILADQPSQSGLTQ